MMNENITPEGIPKFESDQGISVPDTEPLAILSKSNMPNNTIQFHFENATVGKLFEKNGKIHFEGDVDQSAQILFDQVVKLCNN